jgi:hypothetical protein
VLIQYGLSTLEEIETQTKVYKIAAIDILISDLLLSIEKDKGRFVHILKFVPIELKPKLKNYLLYNEDDLNMFINNFECEYDFAEIWYCKNEINKTNIYGRFCMGDGIKVDYKHTLEIIYGNTARIIEQVSNHSKVPYIQANRIGWGFSYKTNQFSNSNIGTNNLNKIFDFIIKSIEQRRENIEFFFDSLINLKVNSICLEFVVQSGNIFFIDWDTENDQRVLENSL